MIGTVLGNRYELLEKIGEGSITEVYKAKCRMLNRIVAVKILKQKYSSDRVFAEKYKNEAIKSARISDSRIVNILDVGSQENINYTVMEYVEGKSLKEILKEKGKLDIPSAVHLVREVSKALDYSHQNGLLHLGIRPSNILVSEEGDIKVSDFSTASSLFIVNVYSAHYFSPEQFNGKALDARSDIYSLGIVFYEMLTGQVPYNGESPVTIALKHLNSIPTEPIMLENDITLELNNLILKAIEADLDKRYLNIKALISDLDSTQDVNNVTEKKYAIPNENSERKLDSMPKSSIKSDIPRKKQIDAHNNVEEAVIVKPKQHKKVLNKKKFFSSIGAIIVLIGAIYGIYTVINNYSSVKVPTIIGLSQTEAAKLVEGKRLKLVSAEKIASNKPIGTVVKCYPSEGSSVKVNSEVRVSISSGSGSSNTNSTNSTSKSKTVPNVVNKNITTAQSIIANAGFNYGVTYIKSSKVNKNVVISQNPSAGFAASTSTVINIFVSTGPS